MMKKTVTACCALAQLSGVGNNTSMEELKGCINKLREESSEKYEKGDNSGLGQKAIFIIATPDEELLVQKLRELHFKEAHQFHRRNGYPAGMLRMFILNL